MKRTLCLSLPVLSAKDAILGAMLSQPSLTVESEAGRASSVGSLHVLNAHSPCELMNNKHTFKISTLHKYQVRKHADNGSGKLLLMSL